MSNKTIEGHINKWPGRYPERDVVADIFPNDNRAINLIHYYTDRHDDLCEQLEHAAAIAGPNLDGIQLNIARPKVSELVRYRQQNPKMYIVLGIGEQVLNSIESSGEFMAMLTEYAPWIDTVLIDPSGGQGKPFHPMFASVWLKNIQHFPKLQLAIAGGLGPQSLHLLDSLIPQFPELSIDAEGQLRTAMPEDGLDCHAMQAYLEDAFAKLDGKPLPGKQFSRPIKPRNLEEYISDRQRGVYEFSLRTKNSAQPRALQIGDILETGCKVLSHPRTSDKDNGVFIHLSDYNRRGEGSWIKVPCLIPIALQEK